MKIKIALLVLFGLVVAALCPLHAIACGKERWPVKTLQDPSVRMIHFTPADSSVKALRVPQPPNNLRKFNPMLRLDQEKQVYTVRALLLGFKMEDDGDFHLVLADPADRKITMVAEIPSPACANHTYEKQFTAAATFITSLHRPAAKGKMVWLATPAAVIVTGVFFFDFIHGQTGVAPNGAELHPVLAINKQ